LGFVILNFIFGLLFGKYIDYFNLNIFYQSKFETKHFIIDLPKFYWIGKYREDNSLPFFMGISIDFSKNVFFRGSTLFDDEKYTVLPIIVFDNFSDISLEALTALCDKSFVKSTQKINNWEAVIYDCLTTGYEHSRARYYIYKDEVFHTYTYIDAFKSQYDKFFEGVRLKE
jgi:hypothetical protein